MKLVACTLQIAALAGCAAMGVPLTSDPREKLNWAAELFEHQNRPIPALRLIREAIDICETRKDKLCLGEAYRIYGRFGGTAYIRKWPREYSDNALQKSIDNFEKSKNIFLENKLYDTLPTVYFDMGFAYKLIGNQKAACLAFDKSLDSNRENLKSTPDVKPLYAKTYEAFEAEVVAQKTEIGC
jgi:tetratricopeptide (TPR) repeat protein